jgi:cell division protein ZapA (FtsZ GTPase activity inhibitor)
MIVSIIISALLAILVIYLLAKLNQRTRQIEQAEKQEKREWLLKVALEQSCQVPGVEGDELAPIEPEIDRLMNNAKTDKHAEEKIRSLIMGLYEAKVEGKKGQKPVTGKQ